MEPKPETRNALLPSAGYADGRPTRHVFSHYEVTTAKLVGGDAIVQGRALIFRCNETGALRKWGFE